MVETQVVNVVGTITYHREIALDALSETLSHREEITSITYEPAKNHWLQTRFAPDDTYVAFYRSGRCSIAGCTSNEHFYNVVSRINRVIRDILELEREPKAEINNIVATADIGASLPLEILAVKLGFDRVEYEPEQFPALVYRGTDYVMLVFASGKLLCTGLTELDDVTATVEDMISQLRAVV